MHLNLYQYIYYYCITDISWNHWHEWQIIGRKKKPIYKKRKFKLECPTANTKLGPQRIHTVSSNLTM